MSTTKPRTYRYAFKATTTVRSVARSTKGMAKLVYAPLFHAPRNVVRGARNVARGAKAGWVARTDVHPKS